jgi:hypothetical protein
MGGIVGGAGWRIVVVDRGSHSFAQNANEWGTQYIQ